MFCGFAMADLANAKSCHTYLGNALHFRRGIHLLKMDDIEVPKFP